MRLTSNDKDLIGLAGILLLAASIVATLLQIAWQPLWWLIQFTVG